MVPYDDRGYRVAFIESFRDWGLFPRDVRSLSEQALRWRGIESAEINKLLTKHFEYLTEFTQEIGHVESPELFSKIKGMRQYGDKPLREKIFRLSRRWRIRIHEHFKAFIAGLNAQQRIELGQVLGCDFTSGNETFEIHSVRIANKIGFEGKIESQVIIQALQHRNGQTESGNVFRFAGGATLIIDRSSLRVCYSIVKNVNSESRLERMHRYRLGLEMALSHLYLGGTPFDRGGDRFAMVHRMTNE